MYFSQRLISLANLGVGWCALMGSDTGQLSVRLGWIMLERLHDILFPKISSHINLTNLTNCSCNGFIDHFEKCIQCIAISSLDILIHDGYLLRFRLVENGLVGTWRIYSSIYSLVESSLLLSVNKVRLSSERTLFIEDRRQGGGFSSIPPLSIVCHIGYWKCTYYIYSNYAENSPIILELFLMISFTYYAQNYASIIRPSLVSDYSEVLPSSQPQRKRGLF